ncbi:MAG: DUF1573 domain-containing protein [Candidatus Hydrogenedentota bacterium]|nr:MAG: DUF1573 domain-containing protein [Candidatus Hydrogenedentota bacterium]
MKSHLHYSLYVALILSLIVSSCSEQPRSEQPRLSIEPHTADFGTIQANDPIVFRDVSLTARNLGRESLGVEDIELPEGFSFAIVPRKVIEGGDEAMLKITMDVRKFSGSVSETGYLLSNDPIQPRMPIKLEATIVGGKTAENIEVADEPDIRFDHKGVSLGTVTRNQVVEYDFPFKNIGKEPLKIYSVETMCLCLTGRPTLWEVPPGGSAAIVAKFEAYKYPGKSPQKSLTIKTNDPDEPILHVTVSANIVDAAVLEPKVGLLPNVQSGQPAYTEVKLIQEGAQGLIIKRIESSTPKISVATSPLEGDQEGYLLKVAVAPDMPEGKFDEVVTIFTNYIDYSTHPLRKEKGGELYRNYSRLRLPIRGSVTGEISVSPQTVNFGSGIPGESLRRKLTISSSTSSFDIKSLSVKDPSFQVSYSSIEPGKKFEISIEFLPGPTDQQIEDELVITTTNAELVVPLFAAIKSDS